MVRTPRYPASPVQEIFLPEPVPFVQFDQSAPSPSNPPAALPAPSLSQCEEQKDRYRDISSMYHRGLAGAEQVREAYNSMAKCFRRISVFEVIERDPALRQAQNFTMDLKQAEEDQRYKQLQYGRVPSILTKYHL
ncbi:conserved hypothetical protein [Neospora caninum Liverpool]|uniref:Uncharacterized protein n=1 Tax=Neospora caninum (strain Liverpool) TaxID=572307 RepID=F0VFX5_NEOCL|nr:conserved hypothetical protein [Neospora caninum Liverpool]CBZ52619.1 conserved hypothetical protein [Neospora caninum Liverpool]CEL66598.1 TPA: hypothetical protein BN1204_024070 [Neospora caninum Liverpool]|eukprot:XP_003882651.1 conserved hypothetical protein [Neospora caninum Liverpool]